MRWLKAGALGYIQKCDTILRVDLSHISYTEEKIANGNSCGELFSKTGSLGKPFEEK